MQFAEATQDIMVNPTPLRNTQHLGLTPGRRRAAAEFRKAFQVLEEVRENDPKSYVTDDAALIYKYVLRNSPICDISTNYL